MSTQKTVKAVKKTSEQLSVESAAIAAGLVVGAQAETQVALNPTQKLGKQSNKREDDVAEVEVAASEVVEVQAVDVDSTVVIAGLVESADSDISLVANDKNCRVNSKGEEECEGGAYWWLGLLGLAGLAAGGGGGGGAAPETVANYRHIDFVGSTDVSADTLLLDADNDARTVNVVYSADESYSDDYRIISVDSSADIKHLNILATSSDDVLLSLDITNAEELESLSIAADGSSEIQTSYDLVSVEANELSIAVSASSESLVGSWWWHIVDFSGDSVSVDVSANDSSEVITYSSIVRSASADNADIAILASNDSSVQNGWWDGINNWSGDSDFVAMSGDDISLTVAAYDGSFIGAYSYDGSDLAEIDGNRVTANVVASNSSMEVTDSVIDVTGDSMDVAVLASGDSYIDSWWNVVEADGQDAEIGVVADGNSWDGSAEIWASNDIVYGDGDNAQVSVEANGDYWWWGAAEISADEHVVEWYGENADISVAATTGYAFVASYWDAIYLEGDAAHVDIEADGWYTEVVSDNDDVAEIYSNSAEVHITASNGALIAGEDEVLVLEGDNAQVSLSVDDSTVRASDDDVIDIDGSLASVDIYNNNGDIFADDDIVVVDFGGSSDISLVGVSGALFSADDDIIEVNGDDAHVVVDLSDSNMWADEDIIDVYGENASVELLASRSTIEAYSEDVVALSDTGDAGHVDVALSETYVAAYDGDLVNISGDHATVELFATNDSYIQAQDIIYVRGGDSANSNSVISADVIMSEVSADDDLLDVERNNISIDVLIGASQVNVDGSLLESGVSRQSDNVVADIAIIDSYVQASNDLIKVKGDDLDLNLYIDPSLVVAHEDMVDVDGDSATVAVSVSGDENEVYVIDDFAQVEGDFANVNITFDGSSDIEVGTSELYDHFGTEHGSNLIQLTGDSADVSLNLHDGATVSVENHVALIDGDDVTLSINVSGDAGLENFSGDDAILFHGSTADISVNVTGNNSYINTESDLIQFESSYVGGESTVNVNVTDGASIDAGDDVLYAEISFDIDSIEDTVNATSANFHFAVNVDGSGNIDATDNIIDIESESYSWDASFNYRDNSYSYDDVLTLPVNVEVDFTASSDASVTTGYGSIIDLIAGESENWDVNVNISGSSDVIAYDYSADTNLVEFRAGGNGSYAGTHSIDVSITDEAYVATDGGLINVYNIENSFVHLAVDDSEVYTDEAPFWIESHWASSSVFSVDIIDYGTNYWWSSGDVDAYFYLDGEDNTFDLSMQTTSMDDIWVSMDAYSSDFGTSTVSVDMNDVYLSGDLSIDVNNDSSSADAHVEVALLDTYIENDVNVWVYEGFSADIGVELVSSTIDDDLIVYASPWDNDSYMALSMDDSYIDGVELYFDDVDENEAISVDMWSSSTFSTEISVDGWWNYSDIELNLYDSSIDQLDVMVFEGEDGSTDINLNFQDYSSVDSLEIYLDGESDNEVLWADVTLTADDSTVWDTVVDTYYTHMNLAISSDNYGSGEDAWGQNGSGVDLYAEHSIVSIDSIGNEDAYLEVEADYSSVYLDSNAFEYIDINNSYNSTVYNLEDYVDGDKWYVYGSYATAQLASDPTPGDGPDILDGGDTDYFSYSLSSIEGSGSTLYLYVSSSVVDNLDFADYGDGYETIIDDILDTYADLYLVVDDGTNISIHHAVDHWTYDSTPNITFANASSYVDSYTDVYGYLTNSTVI